MIAKTCVNVHACVCDQVVTCMCECLGVTTAFEHGVHMCVFLHVSVCLSENECVNRN